MKYNVFYLNPRSLCPVVSASRLGSACWALPLSFSLLLMSATPIWAAAGGNPWYIAGSSGSSTDGVIKTGDAFSIRCDPCSTTTPMGTDTGYNIHTETTSGAPQTLSFEVFGQPAGLGYNFYYQTVESGESNIVRAITTNALEPGSYKFSVRVENEAGVHNDLDLYLMVTPEPPVGEPAICLSPQILYFDDQMVGTLSSLQLVTLRNCGNSAIHVTAIISHGDFFLGSGSTPVPVDLPAGTATTFQVGFAPALPGYKTGDFEVYSNAEFSPTVLPLRGIGTPGPVTTGTVHVNAILNGEPYDRYLAFSLSGPNGTSNFGEIPLTLTSQDAGDYTVDLVSNPPGGGTLTGITPSSTQTLVGGGEITFTFHFTADNDFAFSSPPASDGSHAFMITQAGGSDSIPLVVSYIMGGDQTVTFSVEGLPAGVTPVFTRRQVELTGVSVDSELQVTVGSASLPGIYPLTLWAENQDGVRHSVAGYLAIVTGSAPELVSRGLGGFPADLESWSPTLSSNRRFVAFASLATNLVSGDTNGATDVFVYDLQLRSTLRASVADGGVQADGYSIYPSISGDGQFVAFDSSAGNLVPDGRQDFWDVFVRNGQLDHTVRASVSSSGDPADGYCWRPSISDDGRYVAFESNSSNLVPEGGGGVYQIYVRDLISQTTSLVSRGNDDVIGNDDSTDAVISADGRFVVFFSAATNLIDGATVNGRQVFIRDMWEGRLELVSGAPGGQPPNKSAFIDPSLERLSVSPGGRFVVFSSYASNLVPNDNNYANDVFLRDRLLSATSLVSGSRTGNVEEAFPSASAGSVSADGRFVSYRVSLDGVPAAPLAVRDMLTGTSVIYSVGPGVVLGEGRATVLSGDGRTVAFASLSSNLVQNDTNGKRDIFSVDLPTASSTYAVAITTDQASVTGGSTLQGEVALSAAAPAGGADVFLQSSSLYALVPPTVNIAEGATQASFVITTTPVAKELPVSLVASYGGGSPWTLVHLEKPIPSRVEVLQGDGQSVPIGEALPVQLSVRVVDTGSLPVPGEPVQFAAPVSGPSGRFGGGGISEVVTTNPSGVATASVFTANSQQGQYTIEASVAGVETPAIFSIANTFDGLFADGFESGDVSSWASAIGAEP